MSIGISRDFAIGASLLLVRIVYGGQRQAKECEDAGWREWECRKR